MRVLVVTHVWEPEVGVPQRRWSWLTQTLIKAGHHVGVVAPPPHYPHGRLRSDQPQDRSWGKGAGRQGERIWRTTFIPHGAGLVGRLLDEVAVMVSGLIVGLKKAKHHRPDVVIATAPPLPATVTAAIVGKVFRRPVIIDLRDAWPDLLSYLTASRDPHGRREGRHLKGVVLKAAAAVGRRMIVWALKQASGVITTSNSFAAKLKHRGIARTTAVFNVADLPQTSLKPPPVQSRALNVLYAGTAGRAQELASALRAIARAREHVDVRLRVVGGGAHLPTLQNNARALNIPAQFLPRVSPEQLVEHYQWADTVLIQLQSWAPLQATIPSKTFEVMALGRHITASVDGETAQIIEQAGVGDRVPAQDEEALSELLVDLAKDRARLNVAGKGARWLEENASAQMFEQRFLTFIENTVKMYAR